VTQIASERKSALNIIRVALGVGGVVALLLGVLILIAPVKTAAVVAAIIAIYAIASGIIYAGIGIFSKQLGGWARVGHIVLGVLFVVAGVIAFTDLSNLTLVLALFVTIFIGVSWIIEGIVSLTLLSQAASKGWTVFYAIVSIIAGVFILLAPLFAAAVLWLVLAISLIVLGVVQVIRAFTFRGDVALFAE